MSKKVRITQVKSQICTKAPHRLTMQALGLRRMNQSVEKELTPAVKGMIDSVSYLLKVEELN
ncbi:50S ribosomal protein L30 [bacterium]|nr:50S ribosomal protein L30 [bacterium]